MTKTPFYGTKETFFADVTGDGTADAIAVDNYSGIRVRRSENGRIQPWTDWWWYGELGTFFADVNDDKKADAIGVNHDGVAVRESNGRSFYSPDPLTQSIRVGGDGPLRQWGYWTLDAFYGTRGTFFADVTGDGTADAIAVNDDGIRVRRSNALDFFGRC